MKKCLVFILLILIPIICLAKPLFIDARIGDYDYISRLVLEFTEKIDCSVSVSDSTLYVAFDKASYNDIIPINIESENVTEFAKYIYKGKTTLKLKFRFPITIDKYGYKNSKNKYLVMYDIFDKESDSNKEKKLAKVLYLAQKFNIAKAEPIIIELRQQYPNDDIINLYLGHIFAKNKDKTNAVYYYSQISQNSKHFAVAKANLTKVKNNIYPSYEIKPDYWLMQTNDSTEIDLTVGKTIKDNANTINSSEEEDKTTTKASTNNVTDKESKEERKQATNQVELNIFQEYYYIPLIAIAFFFIFFLISLAKKNKVISEYVSLNDRLQDELYTLEKKLKKGIVHTNSTKEKIIIKLYDNGWSEEAIAKELNTSVDIVSKTLKNQG
jgi:hypothetical protein